MSRKPVSTSTVGSYLLLTFFSATNAHGPAQYRSRVWTTKFAVDDFQSETLPITRDRTVGLLALRSYSLHGAYDRLLRLLYLLNNQIC